MGTLMRADAMAAHDLRAHTIMAYRLRRGQDLLAARHRCQMPPRGRFISTTILNYRYGDDARAKRNLTPFREKKNSFSHRHIELRPKL